jgi:hypothetical protein
MYSDEINALRTLKIGDFLGKYAKCSDKKQKNAGNLDI